MRCRKVLCRDHCGREYWLSGGAFRRDEEEADVFSCFMDAADAAVRAVMEEARSSVVGDEFWFNWVSVEDVPCSLKEASGD